MTSIMRPNFKIIFIKKLFTGFINSIQTHYFNHKYSCKPKFNCIQTLSKRKSKILGVELGKRKRKQIKIMRHAINCIVDGAVLYVEWRTGVCGRDWMNERVELMREGGADNGSSDSDT